ncbi:hypothetical protein [Thermococcus sp. ES12]|uniref:hypothetical protein n=1 Tax=Thermococcus sp. ES12 TaxID=1638246 RepID=UPI0014312399|nr:hypothetical protein [Thermococcus sp. ES12]
MKRKTFYRILLVVVIILTVIYTLGIMGLVPFQWSYYITIFMIVLFLALRIGRRASGQ